MERLQQFAIPNVKIFAINAVMLTFWSVPSTNPICTDEIYQKHHKCLFIFRIRGDWIKSGAIVFDCGFFVGDDGKMHGDVCTEEVKEVAGWLAAVPGGSLCLPFVLYFKLKLCEKWELILVGPIIVAMHAQTLFDQAVKCMKNQQL